MIELRVSSEQPEQWQWSVGIAGGKVLSEGVMMNKVAAQLTSQRAFEQRLVRAGLNRFTPKAYRWREQVG